MNKYYVTKNKSKANHAGSKAVLDSEKIMSDMGYSRVCIYSATASLAIVRKLLNFFSLYKLFVIKKHSMVVVEHPMYISKIYIYALKLLRSLKGCRLVFLIHDFETIRNLFPDDKEIRQIEKMVIRMADALIVHNNVMKKVFRDRFNVEDNRLFVLELFDYLCEGEIEEIRNKNSGIAVAGNLSPGKSGYIYKLNQKFKEDGTLLVNLYGINFDYTDASGITYKGSVDADVLPNKIEGSYGLVWDGGSINECDGPTGKYIRINNPHKISLYIAAELPVIIWRKAALARFVTDNNIGILVDSLENLEESISMITDEQYNEYINNIRDISKKVRSGYYLRSVLRKCEELLDK